MIAHPWTSGIVGTLVGVWLVGGASTVAWANHPLERQAECLENKTDNLADVIDDHFDDTPDYRYLCQASVQLDDWAEELDDEIEDGDWACAQRLVSQIACESRNLEGAIARQPACHVPPRAMSRAQCLVREVSIESSQLSSSIASLMGEVSLPINPVGPTGPWVGPNPNVPRYPVYRPSWPNYRDPRFQRGWPNDRPWPGPPTWNGNPYDYNFQPQPIQPQPGSPGVDRRRPGMDWNRVTGSPIGLPLSSPLNRLF
ncbi:hypothetical protein K2X85_04000 [bacterium]|nr:hypothetical protein [bacterium]